MKKANLIIGVVVAIIIAVMGVIFLTSEGSHSKAKPVDSKEVGAKKRSAIQIAAKKRRGKNAHSLAKAKPRRAVSKENIIRGNYEGRDKRIAEQMQGALDKDDFKAVCSAAAEAMKSANAELRKEALDALGWFGDKALPELTTALADPDPEVAAAALSNAESALINIEDVSLQFAAASVYMQLLSKNENLLDAFSSTLSTSADALCTPEDDENKDDLEIAADGRGRVVEEFEKMVDAGGKLAECAKESFSFVTGHDWVDAEDARQWAADPEGYEEYHNDVDADMDDAEADDGDENDK